MYKNLIRIFLLLLIIIIIFISYLSIYGIKTKRFNELIKSELIKQDYRLNIDLNEVFIKLNIKEKSFSLNSRNLKLYINDEVQRIKSVDLLVDINSIIKQKNKVKKILINSEKNEILGLLKFIRAYKINLPALYLENIIRRGKITYNIIATTQDQKEYNIELKGIISDVDINILDKEIIEDVNFNLDYKDKVLEIKKLKVKYKKINFSSESILALIDKNLIKIKGDFKNKINNNLMHVFFDHDVKNYLNDKVTFPSKSLFEIDITKKFKVKNYKLETDIDIKNVKLNLKKLNLKSYIKNFYNEIFLINGKLNFIARNKNEININLNSNYLISEKTKSKKISFKYSKNNNLEKYELNADLNESEIYIDTINFYKPQNEDLFLYFKATKDKNLYKINNFKLFNSDNKFIIKNFEFSNNLKIKNFELVEGSFYNKDKYLNDISINKSKNKIYLNSNNFDLSSYIEKSLKGTKKSNFLDIFQNLNSPININVKTAKIDKEHNLKNLTGVAVVKNNKFNKANIFGKFNSVDNFTYTVQQLDGKKVTTIFSDIAKPFVKKFKFIKGFEDGKIDYTSTEIKKNLSKSELRIYNFKLQDMPALTKLLSLASLQGIADLATGQGIRFNEFEMFFENTDELINVNEIYALGPAISILMEGYVEKNKLVSLRGTLVPATTINKTIAKIPLLGNILIGEKAGEGVFGVSFKIKGPPDKLDTRVNPIKTLTPRFITRTLDKIKKSN